MVCLKAVLAGHHLITAGEIENTQLTNQTTITHMSTNSLTCYRGITFDTQMQYQSAPTFNRVDVLGFGERKYATLDCLNDLLRVSIATLDRPGK
jgi:hypothetical protein